MIKFLSLILLALVCFSCGGTDESATADTDSALIIEREPCQTGSCCGDKCCLKGGGWETIDGMTMCCRMKANGNKECVNDPDMWPSAIGSGGYSLPSGYGHTTLP